MSSVNSAIFHAYAYGTAFWYSLRGACRIYDPLMVAGWFRPPAQAALQANDLELYTIRTDGWCLITLALILLSFTNAGSLSRAPGAVTHNSGAVLPYARAVVAATVLHHLATGWGAYQHYRLESHYNTSMGIGVWGNVWLSVTGLVTFVCLLGGRGGGVGGKVE